MNLTGKEAQEIARQLSWTARARGMNTLPRPRKVAPDYGGGFIVEQIPICECQDRRGPHEGVCGNCGGAIP